MELKIGHNAPDFRAKSTKGVINFYDWLDDHWCLLIALPKYFTTVCKTELRKMEILRKDFKDRKVKVLAISINSLDNCLGFLGNLELKNNELFHFPIIADESEKTSLLYNFINSSKYKSTISRPLVIVDPSKQIRLILDYPLSTGRNFYEILRIIDSLQRTYKNNKATPADWHYGEELLFSL